MKILICGASGFLGVNLFKRLLENKEVALSVVRHDKLFPIEVPKSVNVFEGDLRDKSFCDAIVQGQDIVLQMAATTSGARDIVHRPYLHVTDNAVMNSLLLRSSFDAGVKHFIFPSCTVMYQSSEKAQSECEFDANEPLVDSYFGVGHTKLYIEKMCEFYSRNGLNCVVLRHSNIYGPFDKFDLKRSHFVGASIRKVVDAKNGDSIKVWGDGLTGRDLLYVDDFTNAVMKVLKNPKGGIFNLGSGVAVTVNDVVEQLIRISGKSLTISHDTSMPSINTSLSVNSQKFSNNYGWEVETSLSDGLMKSMIWLEGNLHLNGR